MALTQQQWYEKLRSWVPTWFFERQHYNDAVFQGFANIFSNLETTIDAHYLETFIMLSEGLYLDEHGKERGLTRGTGETDPTYAIRVQGITNTTNIPALKAAIDSILVVGCSKVVDNELEQTFYDCEFFYDCSYTSTQYIKNFFTIWINPQVTGELDFMLDRENFYNLEAFYGSNPLTELDYVYEAIVNLVNKNKALGTMYQVIVTDQPLCA